MHSHVAVTLLESVELPWELKLARRIQKGRDLNGAAFLYIRYMIIMICTWCFICFLTYIHMMIDVCVCENMLAYKFHLVKARDP